MASAENDWGPACPMIIIFMFLLISQINKHEDKWLNAVSVVTLGYKVSFL